VCGAVASSVELVPPGRLPSVWATWDQETRDIFEQRRGHDLWWLIYEGVDSGNGMGDELTAEEAATVSAAFSEPLDAARIRAADFYDSAGLCAECGVAYCYTHWSVDRGGHGRCPKGHGKSLDPHWSPDDYD
jgi:hypothetical protein